MFPSHDRGGAESIITLSGFTLNATVNLPSDNVAMFPGWGTQTWGQNGWGDVTAAKFSLTGLSATTSVGTLDPADQVMGLTGLSATSTVNSPSVVVDFSGAISGQSATSSVGSVVIETKYALSGLSATSTLGAPTTTAVTPVSLSGLSLTSAIGDVLVTSNPSVAPVGVTATTSVGSVVIETKYALQDRDWETYRCNSRSCRRS